MYLFNYHNVTDFTSLLARARTTVVTSPTHFSIRCVRVCVAHRVLCGSESTGSERAGRALSIWRPTCPFLSPLFQAVPAGGVARRPRPSALGAQRDQGLHLRPCQRIHRREQDPGRRSGDGPEDPAGGRVLTCERRQLKGLGLGLGLGLGGGRGRGSARTAASSTPSPGGAPPLELQGKKQNKTWVITFPELACFCPSRG